MENGMEKDLFEVLSKYAASDQLNPKENFLTELFKWLLNNVNGFKQFYVKKLLEVIKGKKSDSSETEITISGNINVETQTSETYNGRHVYCDMLIKLIKEDKETVLFTCEHKIDSALSENQIEKYKAAFSSKYTVLITKLTNQHTQEADVSITWKEIIEWTDEFIKENNPDNICKELLENFQYFLDFGEYKPIQIEDIQFDSSKNNGINSNLQNAVNYFLSSWNSTIVSGQDTPCLSKLAEEIKAAFHIDVEAKENPQISRIAWGRKGLDLFGRDWQKPIADENKRKGLGLFVGILSDKDKMDHYWKCEPEVKTNKGIDLVFILDVYNKYKEEYKKEEAYQRLEQHLENESEKKGWEYISADRMRNSWRLAILRKPLIDVLEGELSSNGINPNLDEQQKKFEEAIIEGIELISAGIRQNVGTDGDLRTVED